MGVRRFEKWLKLNKKQSFPHLSIMMKLAALCQGSGGVYLWHLVQTQHGICREGEINTKKGKMPDRIDGIFIVKS